MTHKLSSSISKGRPPGVSPDTKPSRFYHDDTLKTFFRRLDWSPGGCLLATPCGIIEPPDGKPHCVTWLLARRHLSWFVKSIFIICLWK